MDIMWLFTVPVLKLAIKVAILLSSVFLSIQVYRWYSQAKSKNPFEKDDRKKRKPYVIDQRKRDAVLKQGFSMQKVPEDLDAIIVGSGIGALTTGAIMAKAGKRVLILEQHDQAGGCCHTYIDKGYEFDVGIHYIGDMGYPTLTKVLVDQISEGQIEWAKLEDEFDVVSIGYGKNNRRYPVCENVEQWKKMLKKQFPDEEAAIDKLFKLIKLSKGTMKIRILLKVLPLWFSKLLIRTGIIHYMSNLWKEPLVTSTKDTIQGLTSNKDLQAVMCYSWGDYGTPPAMSNWSMQALLLSHYERGGYYPVGGASEIAYNIIPVIENTGGKVLVRAEVEEILYNGSKAMGVKVKKGTETYTIQAPIIVSDAGLYNTFQKLLSPHVAKTSYYTDICKQLKPACGSMSVFVGLDASNEELKLKRQNYWAFTTNDMGINFDEYLALSTEKAIDTDVPLMFVSFPSTKDPNWKNHPGRENKATLAIVTLGNWDWYKEWENEPLKKRGEDYEEFKKTVAQKMIDRTCELFPQIKDHVDFVDVGSPVTNKYYIAAPYGEIYGLDHTIERLDVSLTARLRPKTDIPGLYMTGQDALVCGFTGAMYGGLIAAGAVLERNVMYDLMQIHKVELAEVRIGKKMD